jgi:hypothetical protein
MRSANDLEPVDREEVQELDEAEPDDPEDGEERQLGSGDAKGLRPCEREHEPEPDDGAGGAHLREPQRREPGGKDRLRHGAVDGPERGGTQDHGVAEERAPLYHSAVRLNVCCPNRQRELRSAAESVAAIGRPASSIGEGTGCRPGARRVGRHMTAHIIAGREPCG